MRYARKPLVVDAIKLMSATTVNGMTGKPGDYLLTMPTGEMGFMAASMFEANFQPADMVAAVAPGNPAPDVAEETPQKPLMICLGCGGEVPPEEFERKTGMCVNCLKKQVTCHNCGRTVFQYEIIGTMCRKCMPKQPSI